MQACALRFVLCLAATLAFALLRDEALAQSYPARPIKMIVPFAAGGPTDVTGRILADALSRRLGQPVIVENFGGAGGNVGAARAAQSAPDGYTVIFTNISMAVSPSQYTNLAYDPVKDFVSIGIACSWHGQALPTCPSAISSHI